MDLFLKSLSDEVCSLTQSAAKAEQSHSQLQDEYIDLQIQTRNQLIQSSLGVHIPSSKSSRDTSNSFKNKSENSIAPHSNLASSGIKSFSRNQTIRKSKIRSKSQKKICNNKSENMPTLNRPYKTSHLSSTLNTVRPHTAIPNNLSQDNKELNPGASLAKTLNININQCRQNQHQQTSSRSKQELKFTQRSLNLNSSRLIVPAHPFIISPALGGDGFDYQDYNHFTEIPPVRNERKARLDKAKSPFFARVFSETANPNCPPDSPLRRSKQEKIDYNIHVF